MSEWVANYEVLFWWLLLVSLVSLVISLLFVSYLLLNLPVDYLLKPDQKLYSIKNKHWLMHGVILLLRNASGALFVVAGVIMLVLPGQGLLTIVAGLLLMEFPGKICMERWLIGRRTIFRMINWIRSRSGKAELSYPPIN